MATNDPHLQLRYNTIWAESKQSSNPSSKTSNSTHRLSKLTFTMYMYIHATQLKLSRSASQLTAFRASQWSCQPTRFEEPAHRQVDATKTRRVLGQTGPIETESCQLQHHNLSMTCHRSMCEALLCCNITSNCNPDAYTIYLR